MPQRVSFRAYGKNLEEAIRFAAQGRRRSIPSVAAPLKTVLPRPTQSMRPKTQHHFLCNSFLSGSQKTSQETGNGKRTPPVITGGNNSTHATYRTAKATERQTAKCQ